MTNKTKKENIIEENVLSDVRDVVPYNKSDFEWCDVWHMKID